MRLLDTEALKLTLFGNDEQVRYAILSHRQESEEVSFQQINSAQARRLKGYHKIRRACHQALKDGHCHIWTDTCCIDKSSSAELSEAINSMYKWYEQAEVCYAYLSDVQPVEDFADSGWFTRGWTLQELIASRTVTFFNQTWYSFGTKHDLQSRISDTIGLPARVLRDQKPDTYSIAQRMSWAAKRVTIRTEDIAYCLIGLFIVNMLMLYGEGTKAFIRSQERLSKHQMIIPSSPGLATMSGQRVC